MIRRTTILLGVLLVTASVCIAQRTGGTSPGTGNRGNNNSGGFGNATGNTSSAARSIELVIHIVLPNDHPAGENIEVELDAAAGGRITEYFTNPEGVVTFRGIAPGSYIIRVRGADIKDTDSDMLHLDSFERDRHEFVHVQPRELATAVGSTQGSVSAAVLNTPEKARKEFDKGNDARAKGDVRKALEHYEKAVELYPKYAMAYNNLGATYMPNDPGHARDAWNKALEADPSLAPANANMARLKLLEHNFAEAIPPLEKALATQPTNTEYLFLMSEAQFLSRHFDQALVYARKVYASEHKKFELAHIIAARALEAQNRPDQARIEYEVLLKESPAAQEAAEAHKGLARLDSLAKK